jgi:hypothetical protein
MSTTVPEDRNASHKWSGLGTTRPRKQCNDDVVVVRAYPAHPARVGVSAVQCTAGYVPRPFPLQGAVPMTGGPRLKSGGSLDAVRRSAGDKDGGRVLGQPGAQLSLSRCTVRACRSPGLRLVPPRPLLLFAEPWDVTQRGTRFWTLNGG